MRVDNDREGARNDDNSAHLYRIEAQLRDKENHLAVLHKEADGLRAAYDRSHDYKDDLNNQIHALNKHISVLADQNERLTYELNEVTEREAAMVRRALDRKGRFDKLTSINHHDTKLSLKTLFDIRQKSPIRNK